MEHCFVPWSFGHEGEEDKLKNPQGIATNSSGQFIVGEYRNDVKMFDFSNQAFPLCQVITSFINNDSVMFVISRYSYYRAPTHSTVTSIGLKNIIYYTEDFVL